MSEEVRWFGDVAFTCGLVAGFVYGRWMGDAAYLTAATCLVIVWVWP
jgi:hypothetical protein